MTAGLERRRFLGMLASACVACGGDDSTPEGGAGAGGEAGGVEVRVPLSAVASVGSFYSSTAPGCASTAGGFLLTRDDGGLFAYSNRCTHSGGQVPLPDGDGVSVCCLHHSRFDARGDLLEGLVPGQKSLPHWKVRLEGSGPDATVVVSVNDEETDRTARVRVE